MGSRANHTFPGVTTQPKQNHKRNHKRAGRALKAGPLEMTGEKNVVYPWGRMDVMRNASISDCRAAWKCLFVDIYII